MTKGYSLSSWCVVIVFTRVDDTRDKLLSPPKTKVVITFFEDLHDGCKLILAFNLRLSQAWFITIWRLCDYSNNITPDVVLTMSHWLLAKLLNFTTDIEDGIGVIGVHTHRTDHTRVRKHQWSIRVCIEFSNKEQMNKKHRLMFETLIQCDINP